MTDTLDGTASGTDTSGAVIARLRELIPTLPADFGREPHRRLTDSMVHGELQALILACRTVAPHLTREAFLDGATVGDVVYWMTPALTGDLTAAATPGPDERPPRGSYRSASVTLRPLAEGDVPALYLASLNPQTGHRWRFRGVTPSPQDFFDSTFNSGALAQFMVIPIDDPHDAIGMVSAYNADLSNGLCYLAFQRLVTGADRQGGSGLMIEGFFVFIQYLFDHFTFGKMYIEVPGYNESLLHGGVGALFRKEGELKDHYYFGDRRWSNNIYALYREDWDAVADGVRGVWPEGHFATGDTSS